MTKPTVTLPTADLIEVLDLANLAFEERLAGSRTSEETYFRDLLTRIRALTD